MSIKKSIFSHFFVCSNSLMSLCYRREDTPILQVHRNTVRGGLCLGTGRRGACREGSIQDILSPEARR